VKITMEAVFKDEEHDKPSDDEEDDNSWIDVLQCFRLVFKT